MQTPVSLSIARVVDGWDMRVRHELREIALEGLKAGQCLVALNGKRTMARMIDAVGGVHDLYADAGMRFDVEEVSHMLTMGCRLRLKGAVKWSRNLEKAAA